MQSACLKGANRGDLGDVDVIGEIAPGVLSLCVPRTASELMT